MASIRTLFQLPSKPSWFENITIRPDGTVLATRLDLPELWAVDPTTSSGYCVLRISLPDDVPNQALFGICPLKPDVFAIGVGSYDLFGGTQSKPGSWSIWLADLTGEKPKATKAVDIPEIGMINGIATWDENTVLVTDCLYGKVYKLDVTNGSYSIVLEDETMVAPEDALFKVGINGIKVHRSLGQTYVYFSTTTRYSIYRVPVTVAGDEKSLAIASATACVFNEDESILYVPASGGHAMPVDGKTEPAKVAEVKLR
ncbi:hypothetical protein FGRMN_4081 [Fusarium graminum]|nr:hypothetical protein FGRMN_4081 [Fusarium graminum]